MIPLIFLKFKYYKKNRFHALSFNSCPSTFISIIFSTILQDHVISTSKVTVNGSQLLTSSRLVQVSWPQWGNLCITCFFSFGFSCFCPFLKLPTAENVRNILLILPLRNISDMSNPPNPSWAFFWLENSGHIRASFVCYSEELPKTYIAQSTIYAGTSFRLRGLLKNHQIRASMKNCSAFRAYAQGKKAVADELPQKC